MYNLPLIHLFLGDLLLQELLEKKVSQEKMD
jgi:hypothetical protein